MGISANGNVEITCKSEQAAMEVLDLFGNDLNQTLLNYYKSDGYFYFDSLHRDEDTIYLENESGRIQNCEQLDILLQFLKEKALNLIEVVSADIMTSENYIYEEFEN